VNNLKREEQDVAELDRKNLILTPLTPSYAHVVLSPEWEISIERDGIASEPSATESRQSRRRLAMQHGVNRFRTTE
jgi:hypothetical protein